jgi:hypothetical protein
MHLHIHPESNPYLKCKSVLVVADESMICGALCNDIASRYPNTLVCACTEPAPALKFASLCYCDVLITDKRMPMMPRHKLIENVKRISPMTYTIGVTGAEFETAFEAGLSRPDVFVTQNDRDALCNVIGKGLIRLENERLFLLQQVSNCPKMPERRRKARVFENIYGFSPFQYLLSRRKMNAIKLLRFFPAMPKKEMAALCDFRSVQKMKAAISNIMPFFNCS